MVIPNIVVKVRRPTDEFNGSDSDFEVVSDSGNDDSVLENAGYQRLNDELVDAVVLHATPEEAEIKPELIEDEKIVVNLTQKQITGERTQISRENREKKCASLVMLPKEMQLIDVAVPSSDENAENFLSRSVSSNFADRINTVLARRNAFGEEMIRESLSNSSLNQEPPAMSPLAIIQQAGRKLSDSVVTDITRLGLENVPDVLRKNSMPAILPSESSPTKENEALVIQEKSKTTRWSFYKEVSSNSAVDRLRDETIPSTPPPNKSPGAVKRTVERQHSETVNDFIPDKLKCYLCKSVFKDPRVLDCLHNFCYECLNQIDMNRNAAVFWANRHNSNGSEYEYSYSERNGSVTSGDELSLNRSPQGSRNKRTSKPRSKSIATTNRRRSSIVSFNDKPKAIVCPICGTSTEFPVGGLCRLPQNFLMVRQVDEAITKTGIQQVARIWCNLCSTDVIANAFCMTCGYNLCNFCKEAHKRQRTTCNHEIKMFVEPKRSSKKASESISRTSLNCPIHSNNEIKIFCTNCHQVLCNDCTILLHRGHKYVTLAKASKVYLKILTDNLERTKPLTEYALHSKLKINETSKKINQKCIEVRSEVEQYLSEYFQALEVHKKTLLNQISKARENKMEMVLARQADLDRRCLEANTAINFAEELLSSGNEIEKLTFVGILNKRLEYCQKSESTGEFKINDSLQFLPEVKAPSNKAQNNIPLYGIITTQTASPKLCCLEKTDGLLNLRIHKKAELILVSKDKTDRQMCHGGLTIFVEIKYKDSSSRAIPVQVSDKRDGTYIISFIPDAAGILILTITINGKPVKDSPYTLRSRAIKQHTGIYHCCCFCSSGGSKQATCACASKMPGGYMGCGHGHLGHPGRRHWSCCSSVLENSECTVANSVIHQSTETINQ